MSAGRREREPERREREIEPREPQRGNGEQQPGDAGDDAGERDRRPVREARLRREDGGRVAADGHERAVPERDLARVAGEDVEAADGDEVDADVGVLGRLEVVDEERQQRDRRDEEDDGGGRRERGAAQPSHHTRLTAARPKRPCGRK